jgi:hypothetical protein
MAVTLQVMFTGLCLFVPDGKDRKMHVLMPHTKKAGHPLHAARLLFDIRHLDPSLPATPPRTFVHVPLEEWGLDLPTPDTTPSADQTVKDGIVRLESLIKEKVKRNRFDPTPPPNKVNSRVTLRSGAMQDLVDCGALWEAETETGNKVPTCMAHIVDWAAELTEDTLTITLKSLTGAGTWTSPKLHPLDDGDGNMVINLMVYHVVPDELPPAETIACEKPASDVVEAKHFPVYSGVFDASRLQAPKLLDCDCDCGDRAAPEGLRRAHLLAGGNLGSSFTCMVAAAPPEPAV